MILAALSGTTHQRILMLSPQKKLCAATAGETATLKIVSGWTIHSI